MTRSFTFWFAGGLLLGVLFGETVLNDLVIGICFGLSWGIMLYFLFGAKD